jgi:hypothetical protein
VPSPGLWVAWVGPGAASGAVEDTTPEDAAPADDESPLDEVSPFEGVLARSRGPSLSSADAALGSSPTAGHGATTARLAGPADGHFLAAGRALRHWLQSQIC